jgi:hypothetical protein
MGGAGSSYQPDPGRRDDPDTPTGTVWTADAIHVGRASNTLRFAADSWAFLSALRFALCTSTISLPAVTQNIAAVVRSPPETEADTARRHPKPEPPRYIVGSHSTPFQAKWQSADVGMLAAALTQTSTNGGLWRIETT